MTQARQQPTTEAHSEQSDWLEIPSSLYEVYLEACERIPIIVARSLKINDFLSCTLQVLGQSLRFVLLKPLFDGFTCAVDETADFVSGFCNISAKNAENNVLKGAASYGLK
ncbi:hypothetical protein HUJ04_005299, partial [Dendroctonus ponderosae]